MHVHASDLDAAREEAHGTAASRGRTIRLGLKAARWVAAVVIVSVVVPAATKQWSDNQQQHQLKSTVVTQLASAVARATTDAGFILGEQAQYRRSRAQLLSAYERTVSAWKSDASAVGAQIAGYFTTTGNADEDRLVQGFGAYNYLVQAYIGYCFFYRDAGPRAGYLEAFRTNFGKLRRQVTRPIGVAVPPLVRSGEVGKPGFREQAQNEWAAAIVNASAPLISMVDERQARGFHVGARAFISQIFHPFG